MKEDRYIIKIEKFYNQYVELYNSEKSKLKAFSELSNIQSGLKNIRSLKRSRINEDADRLIHLFLVAWVYETNDKELTYWECYELADDMNSFDLERNIKKLLDDVHGIKSIDQTRKEIINELKKLFAYNENGKITAFIDSALEQLKELQVLTPNLHALVSLMEKIISLEYPKTVNTFNQLSKEDQRDISKVGNQNWIDETYTMPDGFYERARELSKNGWDQKSIYSELIKDFREKWTDKVPSQSTIYRRLKNKGIW